MTPRGRARAHGWNVVLCVGRNGVRGAGCGAQAAAEGAEGGGAGVTQGRGGGNFFLSLVGPIVSAIAYEGVRV